MFKFFSSILDLIYPRNCIVCNEAVSSTNLSNYICEKCIEKVFLIKTPFCDSCGYPFFGKVEHEQVCPHCTDMDRHFQRGRTAFLLKDTGRALIHEIKYNQGLYLNNDIEYILKQLPDYLEFIKNSVLVPVPLHPRKKRERGFNQSEWLAAILKKLGSNVKIENLLVRIKDTTTQTFLDRKKRYDNVKNAFALSKKSIINRTYHYIILDDVFTTGATLNACANVLRKEGASQVDILTLGHG